MTTLIIDTSGPTCYLALAHQGVIIPSSITTLPQGRELSKTLFVSVFHIVNNKKPNYITLGTGPGSFTGTRVGVTTAQALAYGWDIPLIPFASSLLPDLAHIAATVHHFFSLGNFPEITLEYFPQTT